MSERYQLFYRFVLTGAWKLYTHQSSPYLSTALGMFGLDHYTTTPGFDPCRDGSIGYTILGFIRDQHIEVLNEADPRAGQ